MKFTEAKLEKAVIELFEHEGYEYVNGEHIRKEISEVLLKEDLKQFLLNQYSNEGITLNEIELIIRQLESFPSTDLYQSNKTLIDLISKGFTQKREDRNKKDLFISLIDYDNVQKNSFKIVNQLVIKGYEKRIPDAIVYINKMGDKTEIFKY